MVCLDAKEPDASTEAVGRLGASETIVLKICTNTGYMLSASRTIKGEDSLLGSYAKPGRTYHAEACLC